jgi:hypothetical protein
MNRLKTIVLFAGIFGIGLGAISLNDGSAESLSILAATPQTQNELGMLGHVEYKILDAEGSIKQYLQTDNTVVIGGMDCVSRLMFDNDTGLVTCNRQNSAFDYIAIGNASSAEVTGNDPPAEGSFELDGTLSGACADATNNGEMARKLVVPTFTAAVDGGSGTIVVLDTKDSPFDFDGSNATGVITQSGIFNADEFTKDGNSQCTVLGDSDMFAMQNLSTTAGIAVSDGDSLSVKWTITVG